jgi:hypothetical protein
MSEKEVALIFYSNRNLVQAILNELQHFRPFNTDRVNMVV